MEDSKSIVSQINQLVTLINDGEEVVSPAEKKAGEKMISIFVDTVTSSEMRALQAEGLVRAIQDLTDGMPSLRSKVMGLALNQNSPYFFSEESPQTVKGDVVLSVRLQPDFLKTLNEKDPSALISEEEVMPAIFLCITQIAKIKKQLRSDTKRRSVKQAKKR
jgi:hypothetical protein